jgi:hypothetical protein
VLSPDFAEHDNMPALVRGFVILDIRSSRDHPIGDAVETFIRRKDAERFVEEVRGGDLELAPNLRIDERELEARALNQWSTFM